MEYNISPYLSVGQVTPLRENKNSFEYFIYNFFKTYLNTFQKLMNSIKLSIALCFGGCELTFRTLPSMECVNNYSSPQIFRAACVFRA